MTITNTELRRLLERANLIYYLGGSSMPIIRRLELARIAHPRETPPPPKKTRLMKWLIWGLVLAVGIFMYAAPVRANELAPEEIQESSLQNPVEPVQSIQKIPLHKGNGYGTVVRESVIEQDGFYLINFTGKIVNGTPHDMWGGVNVLVVCKL